MDIYTAIPRGRRRLTGYAGGLERKHEPLTLEGALQPQLWSRR